MTTPLPKDVLKPFREAKKQRTVASAPKGKASKEALSGQMRPEDTRGISCMVREMAEDYQIKFALLVLESNVQSVAVTVSAETDDSRAGRLAEKLTDLWYQTLPAMFEAIRFGRVAFEKVWGYDYESDLTVLESLDPLPYDRTEMILRDGCFGGIKLKGRETVDLSAESCWWLALDTDPLEPHGRSRLSGAARRVYLDRREARRLRALFIQRFAVGWAKAHVESRFKNPETGKLEDGHAKMQAAYEAMRAAGLITFDNARVTKTDGSEGEYLDDLEVLPTPTSGQPLDDLIDGLDVEQLRAMGIPEKTVMEGEAVGSFAMVSQQMRVLMSVVDGILSQYVASFQRYVVDKIVELNWAENPPVLTVSYPPVTEGPSSLGLEAVKSLLTGQPSKFLLSGAVDLEELLQQGGIPTTPELSALVNDPARLAALAPAAPPSPAGFPSSLTGVGTGPGAGLSANQTGGRFMEDQAGKDSRLPDAETAFFLGVPTRGEMTETALEMLSDLYRELVNAAIDKSAERIIDVRDKIRGLQAQIAVAGQILGMLSPWRPRLMSKPPGSPAAKPLTLALDFKGFSFPWLQSAVHFLTTKKVMSDDEFAVLDRDERVKVLSTENIDDKAILRDVQGALVESLKRGEALDKFRGRVEEIVSLPRSQTETLFRTQTKQAFVAGQERALSNPVVAEEFPYVEFSATADTRVRDSHWELDGKIVRRGSPEHALMLRAVSDYNCRCILIPITQKEAERKGIASLRDLGSTAREEYQNP